MEGATPTRGGRTPSRSARTPLNRPSTAEPTSANRLVHTPLPRSASHDLHSVRRGTPGSARAPNNNAPTPHAQAARRALHDRRTAMFTPGKNRRRSQMEQRETPMDILRVLGKKLAPKTKPVSSSSSSASADTPPPRTQRSRQSTTRDRRSSSVASARPSSRPSARPSMRQFDDDDDDEPLPKKPRLSLPIDLVDEDDEPLPSRPRLSNVSATSIEGARRFDPDQRSQYGRESLFSNAGINENEPTIDMSRLPQSSPGDLPRNSDAGDFQRFDDDPTRQLSVARDSGFDFQIAPIDEPSETFQFDAPPMDFDPTSPVGDQLDVEQATANDVAGGDQGMDPVEDIPEEATGALDDEPNQPIEDIPGDDDAGAFDDGPDPVDYDDIPDQASLGGFSDREPFEDIPEPGDLSDEGGVPVEYASSDRGRAEETREVTLTGRQRITNLGRERMPARKRSRVSRYGIEYPSLPPTFVKRVAQTALQSSGISNPRVTVDTLTALTQASEWFFEQLGDDLGAYAHHAKRKTVEESDVITLMRRQRQIDSSSTLFSQAQKHLPRELLQELRMPIPQPAKKRRNARDEEGESIL